MKKKNTSIALLVSMVFGLALIVVGLGWVCWNSFGGNLTATKPVDTIPTIDVTGPVLSDIKKTYRTYHLPEDKNAKIEDSYLNLTLFDAGCVCDNADVKAVLSNVRATDDGYYFLMSLERNDSNSGTYVMPFAMLTGHVGTETHVANVDLYVVNSDFSDIMPLANQSLIVGNDYLLIGYAEYDDMTNAQMHFYNSDYQISIIHLGESDIVITPYGYVSADDENVVE